jgi:nicotinate-nucleotide--dimethylbenzimidazole phosphoribosyltransferase
MTPWYSNPAETLSEYDVNQALARQEQLTKPPGSLGMLEDVAVRMAGLLGCQQPRADNVFIAIFAADHGVVAEGVSAFPQAVTGEMVRNFARGGAAITVMARQLGAMFQVANVGTVEPLEVLDGVVDYRVGPGTENFAQQAAMTQQQLEQALEVGSAVVESAVGEALEVFIAGEMGIGNTTSASAISAWLLDESASGTVGPGTGIDEAGVSLKAKVIDAALALHADEICDAMSLLRCVGGFEIAAMAGAYIRAAQQGIPCLLDGFISTAAAACAAEINPTILPWLMISHQSAEPAHAKLIKKLGQRPLLQLDMRLGEASGAAVAVPLLRAACALHNEMATFADAGISGAE